MKKINEYLVKATMYTTPHYFISSLMATVMCCLHGGFISEGDFEAMAEAVTNEIMESNLFTKIVIIALWYGLYFFLIKKLIYELNF